MTAREIAESVVRGHHWLLEFYQTGADGAEYPEIRVSEPALTDLITGALERYAAEVVVAERKRCSGIAQTQIDRHDPGGKDYLAFYEGARSAASEIRRTIRGED